MSKGRRLLYTIPAITPCMQRKIIIYVYGILQPSSCWWHAQGAQVVVHHPGNNALDAAETYHIFLHVESRYHLLVSGNV
jgi:hypothetical protein